MLDRAGPDCNPGVPSRIGSGFTVGPEWKRVGGAALDLLGHALGSVAGFEITNCDLRLAFGRETTECEGVRGSPHRRNLGTPIIRSLELEI